MTSNEIKNAYFTWLYDWMCGDRHGRNISYKKLLMHLHSVEFVYHIPKDDNRADDGMQLRYRFADSGFIDESEHVIMACLDEPCSVLEMMVALANRCEEEYMDDPAYGDRTTQWFWEMVATLGVGSMHDVYYDKQYVDEAITRFLNRKYDRDGSGGLFRVRNCSKDMRRMEIWQQMCYYLNTFA